MIVTITNTSGGDLNALDVHEGGSGATGGVRKYPLPFPFGHIGTLANAGTSVLAVKPEDWRRQHTMHPLTPNDEWNLLVQAGKVTVAFGAEADKVDQEELFLASL